MFTIGIGGAISIISLLNNIIEDSLIPLVLGLIWFSIFGALSIVQFSKCDKIQNKIRKVIKLEKSINGNKLY